MSRGSDGRAFAEGASTQSINFSIVVLFLAGIVVEQYPALEGFNGRRDVTKSSSRANLRMLD